jgi:hypothetical protein
MNKIRSENALQGSAAWVLTDYSSVLGNGYADIEGFAAPGRASPGDTIKVFVSTQAPYFRAEVYRMGYYGGAGGRLIASFGSIPGRAQVALTAKTRGEVSCQWDESISLSVSDDWTSGCYLIKLIAIGGASDGKQSYVSFVVRSLFDKPIEFVVHRATATDAAYNTRLGHNLYDLYTGRANAVTLDRPEASGWGAGGLLLHEYPMIRWLEREGFSLAYICSSDLHQSAAPLLMASGFLSIGHDEYWSCEMRKNVEGAVDQGVSVGFFGANACYWQVRFENTPLGAARAMVCYKQTLGFGDDPEVPFDPQYTTTTWRDPILGRPEQLLIGAMFYNWEDPPSNDFVAVNTQSWPYKGTGSFEGEHAPGLIGYEVDRIFRNTEQWQELGPTQVRNPTISTIEGLLDADETLVIRRSPFAGTVPNPDLPPPLAAETVLTIHPSLARAFAAGTVDWGQGLLDVVGGNSLYAMHFGTAPGYEHKTIVNLTRNLLHNFTVGPLGIFAFSITDQNVVEVYKERWSARSAVLPWRPHRGQALAGKFLQAAPRSSIALLSNPSAGKTRIAFLEYQWGNVIASTYQERTRGDGAHLLNGWHDAGDFVLKGDFLRRGHDQFLFINNDGTAPNIGRLTIIDYFQGAAEQAHYEKWGDSELLNGWCDTGDIILAGDFLARGNEQVLFINNDGTLPNIGRLMIVDYSQGAAEQAYYEKWGDSDLLNGWCDPEDTVAVGDFMNVGHDQVLFINRDGSPPNVGRITIIDYSSGTAETLFLQSWADSAWSDGWLDEGDLVIAGDFFGLGYKQLLLINNDCTPPNVGRVAVVEFSSGAINQTVLETGTAFSRVNGWSLADIVLVGKFDAGGEQVVFLPT